MRSTSWSALRLCLIAATIAACDSGGSGGGDNATGGTGGSEDRDTGTGGTTGGSTGGNVGGSTGGNVGGSTGGNVGGSTGGNVGGGEGGNIGGGEGGNIGGGVGGGAGGGVGGGAGGGVGGGAGGGAGGGVGGGVVPACLTDDDCGVGEVCVEGACVGGGVPAACEAPTLIEAFGIIQGSTPAGVGVSSASCANANGTEVGYVLDAALGTVCLSTAGTNFDTVLSARALCGDAASELACNDDVGGGPLQSRITVDVPENGAFVFVGGYSDEDFGDFTLAVTPGPCGGAGACEIDADCDGPNEICDAGECVVIQFICDSEADCQPGELCIDGNCVPPPERDTCEAPEVIAAPGVFAGTTADSVDVYGGSCGGNGAEVVYQLAAGLGEVCLSTAGSLIDTALYVRGTCADDGTEVACNDDVAVGIRTSEFAVTVGADAGLFVFVDGFFVDERGPYTLTVTAGPCAPRAACDDENLCPEGQSCVEGQCFDAPAACVEDLDCGVGLVCLEGRCVLPVEPACGVDADCAPGLICLDGACVEPVLGCRDSAECAEGELCLAGECIVASPAGSCEAPTAIDAFGRFAGTLVEGASGAGPNACPGGDATEQVFVVNPALGAVCLQTTGTPFDTVLYGRSSCADGESEIGCNDDANGNTTSELELPASDVPTYVYVDGYGPLSFGDFVLTVSQAPCGAPPPACLNDANCGPGRICVDGQCAFPPQCVEDADCEAGLLCRDGNCFAPQCVEDADCADGFRCQESFCELAACAGDVDCFVGEVCFDGVCRADQGGNPCLEPVVLDALGVVQGDTTASSSIIDGTCGNSGGREVVYALDAALGTVCASTFGTAFDTVLRLRETCDAVASESACNDDLVGGELSSRLTIEASDAPRFLIVDGFASNTFGPFTLTLTEGACPDLVPCLANEDCAEGTFCFNSVCLPPRCGADADCAGFEACIDGRCRPRGCEVDVDCNGGICQFGGCVAPECVENADCAANAGCQAGRCVQLVCEADQDCPADQRCANGGCVVPTCEVDDDCAFPLSCESFECQLQACEVAADCREGAACIFGTCSEPQCTIDEECPAPLVCADGACADRLCEVDVDCGDGFICVESICRSPECTVDAECGLGRLCENSRCVDAPACAADGECAEGQLCIDALCLDAPTGDACDNAADLDAAGVYAGLTTDGPSLRGGSCAPSAGPEQVFLLPAGLGVVCVDTFGTEFDTVLYARSDCDLGATELGCNDDTQDLQSELTVDASLADVFLFVDGFREGASGDFVLNVRLGACGAEPSCQVDGDCAPGEVCVSFEEGPGECVAVPPECASVEDCVIGQICVDGFCVDSPDACLSATLIDTYGDVAGTTENAPTGTRGTCGGNGAEAVYELDAALGEVCVSTEGTGFDTVVYVRSVCDGADSELACDDDSGEGTTSRLTVPANDGPRFLFVDTFAEGVSGDFLVDVSAGPCACRADNECDFGSRCVDGACVEVPAGGCLVDDDCAVGETCVDNLCAGALSACEQVEQLDLAAQISVQGTTAGLEGSTVGSTCGGGGAPERVYALTLVEHSIVNATLQGFDTVLAVRGTCDDAESEIACNDDVELGNPSSSLVDLRLAPGTWFFVVDGFGVNSGDFVLDISVQSDCPGGVAGTFCGQRDLGQTVSRRYTCEDGAYTAGPGCLWTCVDGACQNPPAEAGTCADPLPLPAERNVTLLGNTLRAPAVLRAFCGGGDKERVYRLDLDRESIVDLTVTGFDTVLYIQSECGNEATLNGCNNDASPPGNGGSRIRRVLGRGTWYIVVDGRGQSGQYELTAQVIN